MFVYTTKHIHKGTVLIVCLPCLEGMGHKENPIDVKPYDWSKSAVAVCGTCGKEERRTIQ